MPDGKINSLSGEHNHLSDIVGLRVKAKERELQTKAIEDPRINPRAAFADLASSLKTPSEVARMSLSTNFVRRIHYGHKAASG